jgi:hypothetical protein
LHDALPLFAYSALKSLILSFCLQSPTLSRAVEISFLSGRWDIRQMWTMCRTYLLLFICFYLKHIPTLNKN